MKDSQLIASIIIPVLNEEKFIVNCVTSIVTRTEQIEEMEIIIVDGGSNDKTIEKVQDLMDEYKFIRLLHNEKGITPAALNIAIQNSQGKYIIRLDAHAEYSEGYIENSIYALESSDEEVVNVGGPIVTAPNSPGLFAKAISLCLSSIFGVGNSKFRTETPKTAEYVDTVPFGCFRKEVFDELGLFNEDEPRNEDLEFNNRIISAGKKILLDPKIKSTYFSRSTIKDLIIQQFDNGKIVTNKFRGKTSFHNLRHFIPLFFVLYLSTLLPIYFFKDLFNISVNNAYVLLLPLITYLILIVFFSTSLSSSAKNLRLFFPLVISFALIHLSYGVGSLLGFFMKEKKKDFSEFLKVVFPYKTTFERTHFGFFTNLIKFISLRFAYLLYRLNVSANSLTIFSVLLTLPCFYLLYEGLVLSNIYYLFFGYFLIGTILFIDFVDGSLARIDKFTYAAGDALDNLPPDIIRIGSILFFGVITGYKFFMILSLISSVVIAFYLPATLENIQEKRKWIKTIYASRMAITGLRVITLFLMPLTILTIYLLGQTGFYVAIFLVITYFFFSILWVFFTLEDKEIKR